MSDLDDFFNKRQKKKKTLGGAKKFDTNEVAKHLEATAAAALESSTVTIPIIDQEANGLSDTMIQQLNLTTPISNDTLNKDEEWRPFESDEHKDYSGLRVNILQNWKDDEEDEDEVEPDEEAVVQVNCPWSKTKQPNKTPQIDNEEANTSKEAVEPVVEQEEVKKPVVAPPTGSYVPPFLRSQQPAFVQPKPVAPVSSSGSYVPPHLRNSTNTSYGASQNEFQSATRQKPIKAQPNFNDVSEFPSLGDMVVSGNTVDSENKFEQPKRNGKVEIRQQGNKIGLENKFDALSS